MITCIQIWTLYRFFKELLCSVRLESVQELRTTLVIIIIRSIDKILVQPALEVGGEEDVLHSEDIYIYLMLQYAKYTMSYYIHLNKIKYINT